MARTPQREKMFKWVGEILPLDYRFFRLKLNDKVNPTTLEQAKKFKIGTVNNGAIHSYLKRNKFTNLSKASNATSHIRMFMAGRFDLIILNTSRLQSLCKNTKLDCNRIEPIINIPEISNGLYMALSKQTSDSLHKKLTAAYQTLKTSGQYDSIMAQEVIK